MRVFRSHDMSNANTAPTSRACRLEIREAGNGRAGALVAADCRYLLAPTRTRSQTLSLWTVMLILRTPSKMPHSRKQKAKRLKKRTQTFRAFAVGLGTDFVNGQWLEATPAQLARFEVANARAQEAIGRLREVEPNWRPVPSVYGTGIESEINRANNLAFEAQARITELGRVGIGPGSFAEELLPARGPERDFVMWERREINRIGTSTGCHTCGTFDPGTRSGNFVIDHQLPTALQPLGQRLYPQCLTCSQRQGGAVHGVRR